MKLRILCSGHLVRYPLGGHAWHHLQYLIGLRRLGHDVAFVEHWGWPSSCYDPSTDQMTSDPHYGTQFLTRLLEPHGLAGNWCYLAEDGHSYGMSREELGGWCRSSDLYLNLSNLNWIDEFEQCQRRVLVDTDPVFTQIGAHGAGGTLEKYHVLFTYGENVHQDGCTMPTAEHVWQPTRQPIVTELWNVTVGDSSAPWTSVLNWTAYGEHKFQGRIYGQKDREFERFWDLPHRSGQVMELAISAPESIGRKLTAGGWRLADPLRVTATPEAYQGYLQNSCGEWCVAKHAYVTTGSGWFSDRSCGYLASGRPVVLQDTGFSKNLPCGVGLLAYRESGAAADAMRQVRSDYATHCSAARRIAEEQFDSNRVLSELIRRC